MDIKYFELRAANKECQEKFSEVAKQQYQGIPIFEQACSYVNNSASYKRTGRHLEIIEISDYYIKVKLSSETKLEMASKSLAGFTRELLRIDQELYPDKGKQLFLMFTYNKTLFKNKQYSVEETMQENAYEISDVEALKLCVEIFCNGMTTSKEEAVMNKTTKTEIKKLLTEYARFQRMNSYVSKMRRD